MSKELIEKIALGTVCVVIGCLLSVILTSIFFQAWAYIIIDLLTLYPEFQTIFYTLAQFLSMCIASIIIYTLGILGLFLVDNPVQEELSGTELEETLEETKTLESE